MDPYNFMGKFPCAFSLPLRDETWFSLNNNISLVAWLIRKEEFSLFPIPKSSLCFCIPCSKCKSSLAVFITSQFYFSLYFPNIKKSLVDIFQFSDSFYNILNIWGLSPQKYMDSNLQFQRFIDTCESMCRRLRNTAYLELY